MWRKIFSLFLVLAWIPGWTTRAQPAPAAATRAPRQDASMPVEALAQAVMPYEDLDWRPADEAERTLVPYARLQLKKARLASSRRSYYNGTTTVSRATQFARQGLAALEQLKQGEPLRARPGVVTECAYITSNDGTVQPYYLYLPEAYDPDETWPLLVFLHGYVPSISVLDPWVLGAEVHATAGRHGFVMLTPYGRRNTDFQGVGELDVFESIDEVLDLYAIDPDRVHLTGVSMGGAGTYYIGLRRPGRFAAYSAMDGQTDMHTWWPLILKDWPADRDDIPPFRRWLVEWDNPIDLVINARNQNYFILHGENDPLVPVSQSRDFVKRAADLGIAMKYYEVPGAGHYIYWDPDIFDKAWSWHREMTGETSPRRVSYKTFSLEYDTAFWCRIGDFVSWGIPAVIDVRVEDDGRTLLAGTENVRTLVIDRRHAPLRKDGPITVRVNGAAVPVQRDDDGGLTIICDPVEVPAATWPPRKSHGMCGPVEEAFDSPFVVVQGTAGDSRQNRQVETRVAKWVDEWDRFADGKPTVLLDKQLTDAMIADRSLVLFGTPETNRIVAAIHDKLPIDIGEQRYGVAGKTYSGDDLGLVMCYPNPLNPKRYVVIYAGELYGERCGINHKHDLIPDFIVFNTRTFNYDDTNQHEVAGFFDMNWKLSARLTWVRPRAEARGHE